MFCIIRVAEAAAIEIIGSCASKQNMWRTLSRPGDLPDAIGLELARATPRLRGSANYLRHTEDSSARQSLPTQI